MLVISFVLVVVGVFYKSLTFRLSSLSCAESNVLLSLGATPEISLGDATTGRPNIQTCPLPHLHIPHDLIGQAPLRASY